jgi:hypothetical protein
MCNQLLFSPQALFFWPNILGFLSPSLSCKHT